MQALVNGQYEFDLSEVNDYDIVKTQNGSYHMIYNDQSYNLTPLSIDKYNKVLEVLVNGHQMTIKLSDDYDQLIKKLGFSLNKGNVFKDIKAPMPGLVLDIMVKEGDAVSEGDQLLILEAMKMENVIKAPGEGVVKAILVHPKDAIEKNAVLIEME